MQKNEERVDILSSPGRKLLNSLSAEYFCAFYNLYNHIGADFGNLTWSHNVANDITELSVTILLFLFL